MLYASALRFRWLRSANRYFKSDKRVPVFVPDTDNIVPLQEVALDDVLKRTGKAKMPTSTEIVLSFLDKCGKGKAGVKDAFHTYFTSNTLGENVGLPRHERCGRGVGYHR